ncbi:MAG: N-acetylglucosamine-6-phosphate deacetylase [Anaerolineae bacterium]
MSQPLLITHARIFTPDAVIDDGWLHVENGRITALGPGSDMPQAPRVIDAQGLTLLPGFIDVHVHGGAGYDTMDATPEALHHMARFYAQHGTTSFLATTWTDTDVRITAALENIRACVGPQADGATLLGAHLEGPYINAEKGGAQNNTYIRRADRKEAAAYLDLGIIRLLALAPEFEENHWLIQECVARGITISAAHTAATYEQILAAAQMGVTQSTHTFNAMEGLHHRKPGMVGAVMTTPAIRCELIADNIHVHPAVMNVLYMLKGADGVILISDAIRSAGMPDGDYQIDDRTVSVTDGVVRLPDGTLAGSTLTMDRALFNLLQATHAPLEALWRTSSYNAACAIGIADRTGSIETGKDADFILVDDEIQVAMTVARGSIVYKKDT